MQQERSVPATTPARPTDGIFEELYRHCGDGAPTLRDWLARAEAFRIAQALRDSHGNRSAAARALGIGRRTLYSKLERLGLATNLHGWGRRPRAAVG